MNGGSWSRTCGRLQLKALGNHATVRRTRLQALAIQLHSLPVATLPSRQLCSSGTANNYCSQLVTQVLQRMPCRAFSHAIGLPYIDASFINQLSLGKAGRQTGRQTERQTGRTGRLPSYGAALAQSNESKQYKAYIITMLDSWVMDITAPVSPPLPHSLFASERGLLQIEQS